MAPNSSSTEWAELQGHVEAEPGKGRTAGDQAAYQLIALAITLAFALVGGLFVGEFVISFFMPQKSFSFFNMINIKKFFILLKLIIFINHYHQFIT